MKTFNSTLALRKQSEKKRWHKGDGRQVCVHPEFTEDAHMWQVSETEMLHSLLAFNSPSYREKY